MQQLFSQLGIDWHLLLSQAVNFGLLLVVLRLVAYKPLLKVLHERRRRIEEGITKAEEADKRLREVEDIGKRKIKDAEVSAMGIIKKTEDDAKTLEAKLLAEAKRKEMEAMKDMDDALRGKEAEARREMEREAAALVRQAIVRTVELSPEAVDKALVERAIKEIGQSA